MDIEDWKIPEETCYCTVMWVLKHIPVSVWAEKHIKSWGKWQDFGAVFVLQCSGWTLISSMRKLEKTIRTNFGTEWHPWIRTFRRFFWLIQGKSLYLFECIHAIAQYWNHVFYYWHWGIPVDCCKSSGPGSPAVPPWLFQHFYNAIVRV